MPISQAQAIEIAEKEARENQGWISFRVVNARLEAGVWGVVLFRYPETPGAHAVVKVSADDGEIVGWIPGK